MGKTTRRKTRRRVSEKKQNMEPTEQTEQKPKRRTAKKRKPKGEATLGRPTVNPKTEGIFSRCSNEQKAALEQYIDKLNVRREKKGLAAIKLSTWLREIALVESGNEHLTDAAIRARQAKESSRML